MKKALGKINFQRAFVVATIRGGANYMTTEDKRQHVRHAAHVPVDFSVKGRYYDGVITNISKGGVFIKTSGTFSVGQDISFNFGKENMDGTIVWVHTQGIGVKFGHREHFEPENL